MRKKMLKNKTLVLTTIFIVALFIGTSINPVLAEELDDRKLARARELKAEAASSSVEKTVRRIDKVEKIVPPKASVEDNSIPVESKSVSKVTNEEETACPLCAKQEVSEISSDNEMELILMRDYGFTSEEITLLKEGISGLKATVSDYQALSISEKQELIAQYSQDFNIDVSEVYDQTKMQAASIVEHKDVKSVPRLSARVSAVSTSTQSTPIGGSQECDLEQFFNSCSDLFGEALDNIWFWLALGYFWDPVGALILFLLMLDLHCGGFDDNGTFNSLTIGIQSSATAMQTDIAVAATTSVQTYSTTSSSATSSSASSQTTAL